MKKLTSLDLMQNAPVIPVIVIDDVAHAVPMARALVAGGIRVLEVTLRTQTALESVALIAQQVPQAIVGVGTLRHIQDIERCQKAGARFAVSPGYTSALGKACQAADFPLLPGVATGSEIMQAQSDGYHALKFFPAVQSGGINMLKAWSGPFFDVKFCPTGGVSPDNAQTFLDLPNVVCVGGSWLTPSQLVKAQKWEAITELARQASQLKSTP